MSAVVGKIDAQGYGYFYVGWRPWTAHRWLMIYRSGGVDPGPKVHVLHTCSDISRDHWAEEDNRRCVAEEYLRFASPGENTRDAIRNLTHISTRSLLKSERPMTWDEQEDRWIRKENGEGSDEGEDDWLNGERDDGLVRES